MTMSDLVAPFPYFGGKSKVANDVWERFGDTPNYIEPFFGSGAMLLARPHEPKIETVNDKDGFVANFWRALQHDPEAVAWHADNPVNENDLHARHAWLVGQGSDIVSRLEGDAEFYDAKVAGWWVWGMSCWIGSGFASGRGPWKQVEVEPGDWQLIRVEKGDISRQLPHLGNAGRGVNRKLPHLSSGRGVKRKRPHLGDAGRGTQRASNGALGDYFQALADRLKNVRVCSGDWSRICGDSPTIKNGLTAVFLDPPYSIEAERDNDLYRVEDGSVAHDVRGWAIERGDNPLFRIALCGYDSEHAMPDTWETFAWSTGGGYENQGKGTGNGKREVIWFSPHCLKPHSQRGLFD